MTAARAARLLVLFVAGAGMGFAVSRVSASLHEEAGREGLAPAIVRERETRSDPVETERAARLEDEAERDALRDELAALESRSRPSTPRADTAALESRVRAAVGSRDGKKCRTLLYDLVDAGREAWPLVDLIAATAFDGPRSPRETERVLGELEDVFGSGRLADLAVDALVNAEAHPVALRRAASACIAGLELGAEDRARLSASLARETDPDVRFDLLVGLDGGEGIAALASIAASDRDARVRRRARVRVLEQSSPVSGWVVAEVEPDAPGAAFLILADVVIDEGDDRLPSTEAPLPSPRTLDVLRDGQVISVAVTDLRGLDFRRVRAAKQDR